MSRTTQPKARALMAGFAAIAAVVGMGCTSTTSTIMQRMDGNEFVANSNGQTKPHHSAKPFKGIPTTVSIPSHVDIRIKETLYFDKEKMTPVVLSSRHLTAETEVVYSDKLISVDPKRPAAGTLDYAIDFPAAKNVDDYDRYQHIRKIGYDVEDKTIQTISNILKNVVPSLGLNPTAKSLESRANKRPNATDSLETLVRTVAWRRFDLNAPDLEASIAEFASVHMNNCHSCSGAGCVEQVHEIVASPSDGMAHPNPILDPKT